ncbi:MAG TPA: IS1595 family transposase [Pyrinomonadaceae bacterium]|jgi:transposase-like protein/IS1 family transposase|nr:IS1595 family transposase [Pyrinomonadaceae bacterium]
MMKANDLPKTLLEAIRYFSDIDTCIGFLADMRWKDGIAVCPRCQATETSFLSTRKIWKCKGCKKQFSVKMGTIFEDSPIGLDKWLTAMWLIVNAKNGISSWELHRAIGVTQKSTWFMLHRIRIALENGGLDKFSGIIEADETYIGGDAKNMHEKKRKVRVKSNGSTEHKSAVLGMIQRGGKVRAQVVKSRDAKTIRDFVTGGAETGAEVMTDQWRGYHNLHDQYTHQIINHSIEYVNGHIHTNGIENFWSLLKRTIKGTYVAVDPAHLQKYVEEQIFRYNQKDGNDQDRFLEALNSITGKRLTYSELIGYESPA